MVLSDSPPTACISSPKIPTMLEYSSIVGIFGDDMQAVGGESLNTMVGYIYDALGNREGRASAAALILFAIIFVVTMINLYVSKKKTHY